MTKDQFEEETSNILRKLYYRLWLSNVLGSFQRMLEVMHNGADWSAVMFHASYVHDNKYNEELFFEVRL